MYDITVFTLILDIFSVSCNTKVKHSPILLPNTLSPKILTACKMMLQSQKIQTQTTIGFGKMQTQIAFGFGVHKALTTSSKVG